MYARLTLLEIDTMRQSVESALSQFSTEVVPRLHDQPGYRGVFVLTTPEGKGAFLSLWDTAEEASVGDDQQFYSGVLSRFATLFKSPPGRERYEVAFVDIEEVTRMM